MTARRWWHSRFGSSFLRELVLVIALLLVYKYGRFLAAGHVRTAIHNARDVIDLERSLGVFSEARLQDLVLRDTAVIRFLNVYYLYAHFTVTIACLVWLYVKKPLVYLSVRRVLVVVTFLGLLGHAFYPLAPPRMLNGFGFVDTAKVFGPNSYGEHGAYGNLANQ
ncbi:MAG: phosphatase PAP2 family protein, partial [Actinomycetota bacterium]